MEQRQGVIISIIGRRGRGPGYVTFDDGSEIGSFEPEIIKTAAANINATVDYTWEERTGKKEGKVYKTLVSLNVVRAAEPPLEGAMTMEPMSNPSPPGKFVPVHKEGVLTAYPATSSPIVQLEESFAMAVRQRELLEAFVKERFREGVHYSDGKMFGSDRPVLLQPGAQLILYAHGYSIDPQILAGPMEPPGDPGARYTIVIRTPVYNASGRQMGAAIGSASSLIWSGKTGTFRGRAADPDKTHNSTIKIAMKRAMVAACRQTTAASEMYGEDIEEGGYGEGAPASDPRPLLGRFIKP